jgi:cytochrome P450
MMLHPHVQEKAHEELDRVLGKGHLPNFSDEAQLPYVTAIVKEVTRWRVVAPMGEIFYHLVCRVSCGFLNLVL